MTLQNTGQRVRYIRTAMAQMKQADFARSLSITPSSLCMIEQQKVLPGSFFLFILRQTYHINLNWLLTGEGEMIND